MAAGWAGTGAGLDAGGVVSAAVGGREPGEGSQLRVSGSLRGETTTPISGAQQVKAGPGTSLPSQPPLTSSGSVGRWEREAKAEPDHGVEKEQPWNFLGAPSVD